MRRLAFLALLGVGAAISADALAQLPDPTGIDVIQVEGAMGTPPKRGVGVGP
jgi:hypothetical protein